MTSEKMGRFDQSFVVRMIRDFFLVLLVVAVVEMGIRFALVIYNFEHQDKLTTELSAEQLANDLKSIMLNSGGPIAARTIYPIFKRNRRDAGLEIAIVPSEATVSSIKSVFDFEPKGIEPNWPDGKFNESTVKLTAEKFCISCHIDAKVGDALGHVTVRTYFSTRLSQWFSEVRLTAMMLIANIVMHSTVLFFLLRVRMEPLLSLFSTISTLSKGGTNISYRAEVKSSDEFGGLALDLNTFLDHISEIIENIRKILTEIVALNHQLKELNIHMDEQLRSKHDRVQLAMKQAFESHRANPQVISEQGLKDISSMLVNLDILSGSNQVDRETIQKMRHVLSNYREIVRQYQHTIERFDKFGNLLVNISNDNYEFTQYKKEIAIIEEKMQVIAESGQALIDRLSKKV